MLKIKIAEIFRHRNETTFRPYIKLKNLFRDVGIQFVFEGNDYDLTWVGQASYVDRCRPYEKSVSRGKWFLENKVEGDFVLFDGQDSASLMGSYDVFKDSAAKLFLKNSLYKDRSDYKNASIYGRTYWGKEEGFNYSINDEIDWNKIQLTGCNWLSTIEPHWYDWNKFEKDIDVCAMFAYPCKDNIEFDQLTNPFYDRHRKKCIDQLKQLPSSIKVAMLEEGKKVPIEQYYNIMMRSKIIIAPFGYGEIAPRDLESSMLGAVLIKPDMSHIETLPNIYADVHNCPVCEFCDWEYTDINEKIESILSDFKAKQAYFVNNMKHRYWEEYSPEKLVYRTYEWLNQLEGYGTE